MFGVKKHSSGLLSKKGTLDGSVWVADDRKRPDDESHPLREGLIRVTVVGSSKDNRKNDSGGQLCNAQVIHGFLVLRSMDVKVIDVRILNATFCFNVLY